MPIIKYAEGHEATNSARVDIQALDDDTLCLVADGVGAEAGQQVTLVLDAAALEDLRERIARVRRIGLTT